MTLYDLLKAGGWIMIVLGVCRFWRWRWFSISPLQSRNAAWFPVI
jgi:hypothetical protein